MASLVEMRAVTPASAVTYTCVAVVPGRAECAVFAGSVVIGPGTSRTRQARIVSARIIVVAEQWFTQAYR